MYDWWNVFASLMAFGSFGCCSSERVNCSCLTNLFLAVESVQSDMSSSDNKGSSMCLPQTKSWKYSHGSKYYSMHNFYAKQIKTKNVRHVLLLFLLSTSDSKLQMKLRLVFVFACWLIVKYCQKRQCFLIQNTTINHGTIERYQFDIVTKITLYYD